MPMYEIERVEVGELRKTYRIFADSKESAEERLWEEGIDPQTEFFDVEDAVINYTRELRDCDCDICQRRGAWVCQLEED